MRQAQDAAAPARLAPHVSMPPSLRRPCLRNEKHNSKPKNQCPAQVTLMALMVSHYPLRMDQNMRQATEVARQVVDA